MLSNPQITPEDILSSVNELELWNKYCPEWTGQTINSPLRTDDIPSFNIKYIEDVGRFMYKDFATGDSGDIFKFVSKRFGISYVKATYKIYNELGKKIDKRTLNRPSVKSHYTTNSKISISVKTRDWKKEDLKFWEDYGITIEVLIKYKVYPLHYFLINNTLIYCKNLSYGFLEYKDQTYSWKIYQPFDKYKWINNASFDVIQGWSQLPEYGDSLIITKSRKDVMSIVSTTNYNSCAYQSETTSIKISVLNQLKSRFKHIYLLYDNDEPGIRCSNIICQKYNLKQIFIPCTRYKDYSDLIKGIGVDYSIKILNKVIINATN